MTNRPRPPPIRRRAPKMWDQQWLTLDDQQCCAEDGGQAPTLDDQKHVADHEEPAGADVRRSDAWRRRWRSADADARRSLARRRRCDISRRQRPTFRNMAPKMEDLQAPTTAHHTPHHPTEPTILPNPIENLRAKEPNPYPALHPPQPAKRTPILLSLSQSPRHQLYTTSTDSTRCLPT